MQNFKNLTDDTILSVEVPAHLYESVIAQLALEEGKQNFGTKDMKAVKVKNESSGGEKSTRKAPKAKSAEKEESKKEPAKEKKGRSLEELKKIYEMLGERIAEMEKVEEAKAPIEEEKEKIEENSINENSFITTKHAVDIVRDALKAGKKVEIDGEGVKKIVPMAGAVVSQSEKVYRLPELEDFENITVDGESLQKLVDDKIAAISAKPKPEPKPVDPEALAKAQKDWQDRFGPGGGYETPIGRYTGD